jgi:hypothetical protein
MEHFDVWPIIRDPYDNAIIHDIATGMKLMLANYLQIRKEHGIVVEMDSREKMKLPVNQNEQKMEENWTSLEDTLETWKKYNREMMELPKRNKMLDLKKLAIRKEVHLMRGTTYIRYREEFIEVRNDFFAKWKEGVLRGDIIIDYGKEITPIDCQNLDIIFN